MFFADLKNQLKSGFLINSDKLPYITVHMELVQKLEYF